MQWLHRVVIPNRIAKLILRDYVRSNSLAKYAAFLTVFIAICNAPKISSISVALNRVTGITEWLKIAQVICALMISR